MLYVWWLNKIFVFLKFLYSWLDHLTEWGFPFEVMDIRIIVKSYLDKIGVTEVRFGNEQNLPGRDFVYGFLKRNNLILRKPALLSRARAAVSPDTVLSQTYLLKEYLIMMKLVSQMNQTRNLL